MVFDEKGGYSDSARRLSINFSSVIKDLLLQSMNEDGMKIEEIIYITSGEVEKICLRNMLEKKLKS